MSLSVRTKRAWKAERARYIRLGREGHIYSGRKLTAREIEILRLVWDGKGNKGVAEALSISIKTVETHMNNIYVKSGIPYRSNVITLMRWGLKQGYLTDQTISEIR